MGTSVIKIITKLAIICLLITLVFFPSSSNSSAEPEYDMVVESNLRYLFDTGGGEIKITVQGELAKEIRHDIFKDYWLNVTNPNTTINEAVKNQYIEAMEDIIEMDISSQRSLDPTPYDGEVNNDTEPEYAGVEYEGNYKIIKLKRADGGRVDIKSIEGLVGSKKVDEYEITIKMDIKGPLLKDTDVILSDGYIILYALWGESNPPVNIKVKETASIVIIGMNSYSNADLSSGSDFTKYRLLMGEFLEYKSEYKLNGYDIKKSDTDTVAADSFNFMQSALMLFIIIIIFSIITKMVANHFVKKLAVNKVLIVRVLGLIFFVILFLIYLLGFDGMMILLMTILFFVINIVMIIGVYQRSWGNLTNVTVRHEDFYKAPPKIDKGPWHERGIANAKVGNFEEAVNCFENALESEPENPVIWNDLGFVHRKLGNSLRAIECFNKALELRPEYSTAAENLEKAKAEMAARKKRRKR